MEIEDSRSTFPDSSFSTISSSSASATSKLIALIAVFSFAIVIVLIARHPGQEVAAASDQGLDVNSDRSGQGPEVIAALEHRHNAAVGMLVGDRHDIERRPDKILFGEIEPAERVGAMRIEACRDDDEIGAEGVERGQ